MIKSRNSYAKQKTEHTYIYIYIEANLYVYLWAIFAPFAANFKRHHPKGCLLLLVVFYFRGR